MATPEECKAAGNAKLKAGDMEAAMPVLDGMGGYVVRMGEAGSGAAASTAVGGLSPGGSCT